MTTAGIDSTTLNEIIRNISGEITAGGVALGAYDPDSISLNFEFEYDQPRFHGEIGILAGSEYIIGGTATLSVTLKAPKYERLAVVMGDAGSSNDGTSQQIGGYSSSTLGARPVISDVILAGPTTGAGKAVRVEIAKAVATVGEINFSVSPATVPVTFESRVDPANPRKFPAVLKIAV